MADELALHRDVDRAMKAEALLRDEILTGALAKIDAEYVAAWRGSSPRDAEARELAWLSLKALERFKLHLSQMVTDGRMAQAEINRNAELKRNKR